MDFSRLFKRASKEKKPDFRSALKSKYLTFESLLRTNNHVLGLMADMEEKLSGEYLFDRRYIDVNVRAISEGVIRLIADLNSLSKDKYLSLYQSYEAILKGVEAVLSLKSEVPVSEFVIPIEALTAGMSNIAGGKIAHLGEVKNRLGLPTPEGFSITAYAFKRFMGYNRLTEKINERLSAMKADNLREIEETSREIMAMVVEAEIPDDLQNAINKSVESLKLGGFMVSVRSSAIHEDGEFSFAGQYATYLNVPPDLILRRYKDVVASLFTPRAIFYYKTKGFSEEDMVMAVGILGMVDARAGGVIYTRDPNDPDKDAIIINAVRGLGKAVVDGARPPCSYVVTRGSGALMEKSLPEQKAMLVCALEGDIKEIGVPGELMNEPCLSDDEIKTLSRYASTIEEHYGRPQDIEWAIGQDGSIFILQSRPLRTFAFTPSAIPRKMENYKIILDRGVVACKGIGYGKAFILRDEENLKDFPEGAVLVAGHTSTMFVTVMNKASAIITDVGSATGHMASLSREYGVPAILDTEKATALIKHGQELTVDAINCNIYEGKVVELLEYAMKKKEPFKDTHLFRRLEDVLKWLVPLSLVDPDNRDFKPEHCRTFHDITRFAHEMAMAEIFKPGREREINVFEDLMSAITFAEAGEYEKAVSQSIPLRAGIPLDALLIDIDGGVRENTKKATPADILSIPFSAFLKGLTGMRWPEPRSVDAKGFLGMIAHTASIPEEELYRMGEKSYAIISLNYMNFSIRLGYHFSMVEAYAGEGINDNYIKFFFKGGGAVVDRRLRRARLIREILKALGFRVNVTGDVIDAMLTKYRQPAMQEKLETLGKLTAYTKQLDMALFNDAVTDMFIEDFVRDHFKKTISLSPQSSSAVP